MAKTETRSVKFVCDIEDGLADMINEWEDNGWRVKFLVCHPGPSYSVEYVLVVFEREV